MGVWTYTDSALGEVLTRRDARNVTTLFCYDKLGRTTYKSASVDVDANGTPDAVVDTWLFDPPGALGQLWIAQRQINSVLEKRSTYTYAPSPAPPVAAASRIRAAALPRPSSPTPSTTATTAGPSSSSIPRATACWCATPSTASSTRVRLPQH